MLIGVPYEKEEDFNKTVEILRKAQPNFIRFYIYTPYPGTDLYNKLIKDNLIVDSGFLNFSQERIKALVSYPNMPKWKIQFNYFSFLFRVYFRNKPLIEIVKLTIGIFIYSYNKYIPSMFYGLLEKMLVKSVMETKKSSY